MYFSQRVSHPRECRSGLAVCILVALAPDVDYLAWWIARIQLEPRATHSLLFCLGCALVAWVAMHAFASQGKPAVSLTTLLLASCSHLVLDFFVGVHGLPLLWPFVSSELASPVGVLPSAGRLSFTNFYLWRNLFIELGVLWPALALFAVARRREMNRLAMPQSVIVLPVWFAFLWWAITLPR